MSIGSANGISNLVRQYSDLRNLDLMAGQAKAATTPGGSRQFVFGGSMIDNSNRVDGQQSWGYKWLDSYRTVMVQKAQTLQRKLNNIYTAQLGGNLYKSIADNPNYTMADLPRQDNADGMLDPQAIANGGAIWAMSQAMNGEDRSDQKPLSYNFGAPGEDWDDVLRSNIGDWAGSWDSRQYNSPESGQGLESIGTYFKFINPLTDSIPTPPDYLPLLPPFLFIGVGKFAQDLLEGMFYPMMFRRYETFAHSEADANAIDAAVIRSDYNFNSMGINEFPLVGQLVGGVLSILAGMISAADPTVSNADAGLALDMLMGRQTNAEAPRQVETDAGGFFAATQALQDWDLTDMSYQYFSAANYQEDFVDTDFLAAFRVAGAKLIKILVNAILTATAFGNILKIPGISFIWDQILDFIAQKMVDLLLGPIRKFVEVDTSNQRTGMGQKDSDAITTLHVGDPGGLFGLGTAWEPAGYALAYRDEDASNVQAMNEVTVYTTKKTISDLWDGRGILQDTDWEGVTFQSVSSRIHNVGYAVNPPLNLTTFRYNVNDRFQTGLGADQYDFDRDPETEANRTTKPPDQGGTYERAYDYNLDATTKMGSSIDIGSRRLNPSFGGGILLTDLDTNRDDVFYYGSAAFLPNQGISNTLTLAGGNFTAENSGYDEQGNELTAAYLAAHPELGVANPPASPNTNSYSYANMGTVKFDSRTSATDAYQFSNKDDAGVTITGLTVTYNGPDTLVGAVPQNIVESRLAENYRVTSAAGNAITAEVIVDTDQVFIDHGAKPAAVAATDWIMANSQTDTKERPDDPTAADDKTTDYGLLNLGLNARVEPLLPQVITATYANPQLVTIEDDSALGLPASKLLRTLDQLRGLGYSQGRAITDTTPPYVYSLQGSIPPGPMPPPDTAGDFMIMARDPAAKTVTLGFNRSYTGLVDVPPNMTTTGKPKEDWTAVNGWTLSQTRDGNSGVTNYAPGAGKIWLDDSDGAGTEDKIWAIQDYSHPAAGTAYPTTAGGSGWSGAGFGTTIGAIWGGTDGGGRDEVYLGRKFSIDSVSGNPADHTIRIRADDGAAVFINGHYVGTAAGYTAWSTFNIDPSFLRPGENIITTQGIDRGGPAGIEMEVKVNNTVVANTSAAQASQWQVLNSPAVSTPDEVTMTKKVTFKRPDGTNAPGGDVPDRELTGDILPGEFLDLDWNGVNGGYAAAYTGVSGTGKVNVNVGGFTINTDSYVSMVPDRAVLTITNAKGTFTVPLTQYNTTAKEYEKKDEGSGLFHIPSDYLAAGDNTFSIDVERGGKLQQFCRNEPPSSPPGGWLYRNLAQSQVQAAGYWINSSNLMDDDGTTVLVPAGSLMYGGQVVSQSIPAINTFSIGPDGIIYHNGSAAQPGDFAFKPDSFIDRSGSSIDNLPLFAPLPGFNAYQGYQLKSDVQSGMTMVNHDTSQEIHTYATDHFDRYVYDPNSQTIMDIMQTTSSGLEGYDEDTNNNSTLDGGEDADGDGQLDRVYGSETRDVPYTGATNHVNTKVPLILSSTGVQITGAPAGTEMIPGMTAIGKAPVGIRISKDDRQTFGSDDNQLTRTLYAAMKPIDVDGSSGYLEADSRAYKEYRDVYNYGLLDHIYVSGSAYSPSGGGFSSTIEFNWKTVDVATKTVVDTSNLGTGILGTTAKTIANSYMNNYEYFANETDRRNKKYTVVRRGDMLMNSFYSFRKEQ